MSRPTCRSARNCYVCNCLVMVGLQVISTHYFSLGLYLFHTHHTDVILFNKIFSNLSTLHCTFYIYKYSTVSLCNLKKLSRKRLSKPILVSLEIRRNSCSCLAIPKFSGLLLIVLTLLLDASNRRYTGEVNINKISANNDLLSAAWSFGIELD